MADAVASTPQDRAAELARVTRAAQGLPPTIEDPATLAKVARIITGQASAA